MPISFAAPIPNTVDLTGLPDPVVLRVIAIVREARDQQPDAVPTPSFISRPRPSAEDSKRLLARMAGRSSGQALPADFSRADLYDDHD